jgi:hypothetical protein
MSVATFFSFEFPEIVIMRAGLGDRSNVLVVGGRADVASAFVVAWRMTARMRTRIG